MRLLVRRLFNAYGINRITEAKDGNEALEELSGRVPDLALIDYAMTPMDGITFTRHLRNARDSPAPYLPIIMMTGYTERDKVTAARDAGVNELVAKPISALSVFNRLMAVIERPRPFIRSPNFVGPERRRRQLPYQGPERRGAATPGASPAADPAKAIGSPPGGASDDFLEI